MAETTYRGRRAVTLDNDRIRLTMLVEGGHIAEVTDRHSAMNPLWTPPWPTLEPSRWDLVRHPEYGSDSESRLLAGIMGHNPCIDLFGGPSDDEAAAGLTVHGEASVNPYRITSDGASLSATCDMPMAGLRFQRRIRLAPGSPVVLIRESVDNLSATDRPIAWTQHVTLGPPFLERGLTEFRAAVTRSKTVEYDFTGGKGYMPVGVEFDWPHVPTLAGGTRDLRIYSADEVSAAFSTHLVNPAEEQGFFLAFSPTAKVLHGYVWKRTDFPWLGIWEENHARTQPPWNGETLTRGMEFGASPMAESRRQMIERGSLFGVPAYRWIGAKRRLDVAYCAFTIPAERIPEAVTWDGAHGIVFA